MRTITLELLRHGPPHNQLLSPLTPYLALCENHGAVTLHVPFEHNQFLHRLEALSYRQRDEEARLFQLHDTAAVLGQVLGLVPGLTAETNKKEAGGDSLTHLRLIISASELALLPFELALSPAGLPGAGQNLLLQPQMPVCLTREVRRSPDDELSWPDRTPRILFAAAAPQGVGGIPLEAHLLALRTTIQPWVRYYDVHDAKERDDRIGKHLVFLPEASIEAIEDMCATSRFTHVHILAHGIKVQEGHDTRYALALHSARTPDLMDAVSGARLATALRASDRNGGGLARPTAVTLASCDSGNVGSVAGAGASIAHALHEAGIAMVVAGQFPLSFDGSVRLVEVLYEGLLAGTDPRYLIYDVRRRLYSQFRSTHDWASLTAYLSLPRDFEQRLFRLQISQAMDSIEAAMTHADELTRRTSTKLSSERSTEKVQQTSPDQVTRDARDRMATARARLKDVLSRIPAEKARSYRTLVATTEKREAEVLFRAGLHEDSKKLLQSARDRYWDAFLSDRTHHWAVVQYLSLSLIIARTPGLVDLETRPGADGAVPIRPDKDRKALWSMARMLALFDLRHDDHQTRAWAHGNLIELYLLSLLHELQGLVPADDARRRAVEHADQLIDAAGGGSFEVYSTRRQMLRYLEWYDSLTGHNLPIVDTAEQIFDRFPTEVEQGL